MPKLRDAYILLGFSIFGLCGIHKFYLGKPGMGILYLLTFGFFGFGTIYDIVTMKRQVRDARIRRRLERLEDDGEFDVPRRRVVETPPKRPETLEHAILRIARKNGGTASVGEVALEGDASTDTAKRHLDILMNKGVCELRVTRGGQLVYAFPDFLTKERNAELEV